MGRSLQVDLQLNIDNARRQLNAFNSDAQKAFKSQGQSSPAYQQAAQQAAQQKVMYRDALAQQSAFNKALQDEAKLRQQNMQAAQRAQITQQQAAQRAQQQSARNYSPATQTLASALPGGSILGSGLSAGGIAALAGASAVAAAVAAVGAEFSKLGDRARELASTSSNASSQLGQLRSAIERNSISTDINATSPGVVGFQKFTQDLGTNLGDAIAHATSSAPDRAKALQEKIAGGLGQGNEDWRRLKEQGVDMQTDIGLAQTAMQVKYQRQARDFDLSQRKFQVDTANQVFDLQKQASRQQFDQQIAVQKFQENFANKQSQKAYDLSRQFATQSFAISQGRAVQDYNINRGDKQADFARSLSDKRIDYTRSRADQSFDFNLNKSRSVEDRNIQLQDMALSGASGLDYFRAARSFNLSQRRNAQDFQISQGREARDYGIGQGREIRDFSIGQGRDARNFGISQGRANQDFQQQAREALASRRLELEAQEYARKYEGLELQTQINRQTQDLAISFQRLNQSINFQKEGFANQKSDMAYDKRLDYSNFALQTGRQLRNFNYAEADYAGAARSKDPLGALGLSMQDPAFAQALGANAKQSGQTDLASQVQAAIDQSNNSPGAKIGDIIQQSRAALTPEGLAKAWDDLQKILTGLDVARRAASGGSPDKLKQVQPIQTGSNIYNFNAGMGQQDQQNIQDIVDKGDAKTANDIMEYLRRQYGG